MPTLFRYRPELDSIGYGTVLGTWSPAKHADCTSWVMIADMLPQHRKKLKVLQGADLISFFVVCYHALEPALTIFQSKLAFPGPDHHWG